MQTTTELSGLVVALVLALVVPARAWFGSTESWSNPPSVEGWTGGGTYPHYNGGPGNPYLVDGGFLGVRSEDYPGGSYVYATLPAAYAGDWGAKFGTSGSIEFDIKVWAGTSATPAGNAPDGLPWGYDANAHAYSSIHAASYFLLYQPSYAGWRYALGGQGPAAGVVHRAIPFDATWSDAQAAAAGWIAGEYGGASWAATVANVGVGVQQSGLKLAATAYSLHVGIDHFTPGPVVGHVGHTTTWTTPDDLAGFDAPEGTEIDWMAEAGNPGGFLQAVGATAFLPKPYIRNDMGAVFGTGPGTIAFDLRAFGDYSASGGSLTLSTGTQAFRYFFTAQQVVGHDQTAADGWVRYVIPWKADWTESQAAAAGWQPYGASDQWAAVIADPIWSALSISGSGTSDAALGLDNFRVEAGEVLDAERLLLIEPPPPREEPVLNYAFDEGAGDVLHDRSGGNTHATIHGATWVPNGERWALEFDGVDDFVDCGATGGVRVVGPQTLVAWILAEPVHTVYLSLPILGNGRCQFSQRNHSIEAGATGFLPFQTWVHAAAVWDGNTVRLYVDGTLVNVVVSMEPTSGGRDFLLANPRTPVEGEPPEYNRRFKGRIASVMLYNRPLTHEEILQDLRTSNVTGGPMAMPVAQPGLGRIKVEVDAARLGQPLAGGTVRVDVLAAGGTEILAGATVAEFDAVGRAVVDVEMPDMVPGDYVVRTTAGDGTGDVLGEPGEAAVAWRGTALFPSGPAGARKLNNLVTELLRVAGPDTSEAAHVFDNPRTGFIHVSNRGASEAEITAEAGGQGYPLVLARDYDEAYETQRYLPAGRYTIATPVARDLIVRAVAQTVYDYAWTDTTYVTGFGPYAGEFEEHHVFPHYNTFLVHDVNIGRPFAAEWKSKGRRLMAHMGTAIAPGEGQSEVDAICEMLSGGDGFSHATYSGYLVDEFSASNDSMWSWASALDRLLVQPEYAGRTLHAWDYALYDLVSYAGGGPGREFVRTLGRYDCPVQWECYLDSVRTELSAWRYIEDKMVGEVLAAEAVCPGLVSNLIVVPYAYVTAGPPWLTMTLPGYDTRTYMELQVRTVATDPAFAGVRGLGVYRSPYADEETTRWTARLFRHYAIEGRTEPLGTHPFLLTHIRNPEFEEQGLGWGVAPSEPGSIRFGLHHQFGSIECRYTGRNGDTVLITRRSEQGPNVFSQTIRNLEPGRLYSFRMFSGDHQDLSTQEAHAVRIEFEGAELVPEKCFTHVGASRWPNTFVNWHVRVFRAKGTTATLRISDWADPPPAGSGEAAPGGPIGQELMYNFIKVQPYWLPEPYGLTVKVL